MEYKISIICPVYNLEMYVGNAIQSVLNQTYINWELIVVDDGSRDSSPQIIDNFVKLDKRIRAYHKPNEGVTNARKYALDRCSGDFVLFLDGDDTLPQYALSKFLEYMEDDVDIVVAPRLMLHNDIAKRVSPSISGKFSAKKFAELMSNGCFPPGIGSKIYRKSLFYSDLLCMPAEIKNNEDLLMNLRLCRNSRMTKIVKGLPLYECNIRTNSASRTPLAVDSWIALLQELQKEYIFIGKIASTFAINVLLYRYKSGEISHEQVLKLLPLSKWSGYVPFNIYSKYTYLQHPNKVTNFIWQSLFFLNQIYIKCRYQ